MLRKFLTTFSGPGRAHGLTDAASRRRAWWHYQMIDHGFLRYRWTNFDEVAPGVFRSNHPHESRLRAYRDKGIKAVLNLRGENDAPAYLLEKEACAALGLDLISVKFAARGAPIRDKLLELFDAFDTIQRPFLMHCKSGADRTGLAAALYLMVQEGQSLEVARRQLGLRYLHIRRTATGILDHFLDVYADRAAQSPIGIVEWIETEYDPHALSKSFAQKQAALKFWQGWR
jgi:protein tyrosine/serine phosphatase